jgi:hypothetical protein
MAIGEPQRAFSGAQFALTLPGARHHGVELWVPEVGGRVDPDSEAHGARRVPAAALADSGELGVRGRPRERVDRSLLTAREDVPSSWNLGDGPGVGQAAS